MSEKIKKDIRQRVNTGIRELSAYSVPHIDCSIKLDGNESPFNLFGGIWELNSKWISDIELNRYPDPSCAELREKISAHTGVQQDGITLGNGSDELIQMLAECFTGGSGTVLVPTPTFSMYRISSTALGAEVIQTELDEAFDIAPGPIKKIIYEHDPDLLFFATPNNPTGNCFSKNRLKEVIEATSGLVVLDEAYCDYSGVSYLDLLDQYENVVVLRTMSKIGFAALRLGILLSSPVIAAEINKVRLPYNINTMSQVIASRVFDNYEVVERKVEIITQEREKLYRSISEIEGAEIYPSDANFFLVRVGDSNAVFEELVKRSILVRRMDGVERLSDCLRITVGKPEENSALVDALSDIFSSQVDIVNKKK